MEQRIKEIGIMKVIGASLWDIKNMFILETDLVGLLGGIGGVVSGCILGRYINIFANYYFKSMGENP